MRKFAEAHGRRPPASKAVALAVPPVRRNFARKNTSVGQARSHSKISTS
ncbi:hypothetical protein [uncultured Muribaculum sp.]|nr:hypothetical protein [uncultured Muribaculum sp.]